MPPLADAQAPPSMASTDSTAPPPSQAGMPGAGTPGDASSNPGPDTDSQGPMPGAAPDAAAPAPQDAAVGQPDSTTDDGSANTDSQSSGTMRCGDTMCMTPLEFCCVDSRGNHGVYSCVQSYSDCSGPNSTAVHCTSSSQCGSGQFCCGTEDRSGWSYSDVSCQTGPCNGSNGLAQHQFCDPQEPTDCNGNTPHCQPSSLLTSFDICRQ
jgi:hypothetical protein